MIGTQANPTAAVTASPRGRRWLVVVFLVAVALLGLQVLSRATQLGSVELDQAISPEHYKAVAEVIGYVMKLRRAIPAQKS